MTAPEGTDLGMTAPEATDPGARAPEGTDPDAIGPEPRTPELTTPGLTTPELMPLQLHLPDGWWPVDVRSERARDRSIGALVEHQVGRADHRTGLRAELRTALRHQARDAMRAGAFLLAISLMRHDDLPLPAAVVGYRVPRSGGDELRTLESALVTQAHESLELAVADHGSVLRRTRSGDAQLSPTSPPTRMLRADYWLDLPGAADLVLLTFSTPMIHAAEGFLELFDAIAATVTVDPRPPQREEV
jgi:hypothetical protein